MQPSLYSVFLYGVNIPGGLWLTMKDVEVALHRLEPDVTFARVVGRPDSILVWSSSPTTEDSVRRAVGDALKCLCIVIETGTLEQLVSKALSFVRALAHPIAPPYRLAAEGIEWELCLILSSDLLPASAAGKQWLFSPTRNAVALEVLDNRALLARKRRHTPKGHRVMLGSVLIDPWEDVLEAHGVRVTCLTSRTLNRVAEVVAAARVLKGSIPP